jgi:hypothetical protein
VLKISMGVISIKPSRDFTRPLAMPRGFIGLLHMPNEIVFPIIKDLCFMFSFYVQSCIAKGLAICKFEGV